MEGKMHARIRNEFPVCSDWVYVCVRVCLCAYRIEICLHEMEDPPTLALTHYILLETKRVYHLYRLIRI